VTLTVKSLVALVLLARFPVVAVAVALGIIAVGVTVSVGEPLEQLTALCNDR
jgi:hypothetical protein